MSKRLWTETHKIWAKKSTQKLNKTKAKLSQAERFGQYKGEKGTYRQKVRKKEERKVVSRTRQGFGELIYN